MNEKIQHILNQINELEAEMQAELNQQKEKLLYQIQGKRIEFEKAIRAKHRQMKTGLIRWFLTVRPLNYLTAPVIYGMAVPMLIFDVCIMFYQLTCFPIYRIPQVKRSDYFSYDHRHLAYLNMIEKFHCLYCSYANGLMAFASEVVGRTEQYFCPIKHAHRLHATHRRAQYFLEYGDAEELHRKFEELRNALIKENQ